MLAGAEARQVVADGPYVIAIQFCQQTDVALREVRTSSIHRVIDLACTKDSPLPCPLASRGRN